MKWVMGKKGLLCVALLVGVVLVYLNYDSGYGPVSSQSYQFSKAIYGACQNKNEGRLQKVCELMEGPQGADLPAHERKAGIGHGTAQGRIENLVGPFNAFSFG